MDFNKRFTICIHFQGSNRFMTKKMVMGPNGLTYDGQDRYTIDLQQGISVKDQIRIEKGLREFQTI